MAAWGYEFYLLEAQKIRIPKRPFIELYYCHLLNSIYWTLHRLFVFVGILYSRSVII